MESPSPERTEMFITKFYFIFCRGTVIFFNFILFNFTICIGFAIYQRDGMGREEGSGWGTHVYLWQIHFDI